MQNRPQNNLKQLLERLLQHDTDFVLAGGFACVVHGSPLVTQDIGQTCRVVSIEDLIRIKETMGRPKDKEALLYLRNHERIAAVFKRSTSCLKGNSRRYLPQTARIRLSDHRPADCSTNSFVRFPGNRA